MPCKRCSSICVSQGLCHQQRHAVNVGSAPSEQETTARWRVPMLGTTQHAMPALFQELCMHTAAFAVLFFLATLQRGGPLAPKTMPCCCSFAASLGLAAATRFAISCVRLDGDLSCFLCCECSRNLGVCPACGCMLEYVDGCNRGGLHASVDILCQGACRCHAMAFHCVLVKKPHATQVLDAPA